jgi:hypothetical protein
MGNINQEYKERVRYSIYHKDFGTSYIDDPIGWNDDQKEYSRNKDYHGIMAKFSNNLTFLGNAFDLINMIFDIYDINSVVKLTREQQHPQTDEWIRVYWGYLDFSTRTIEGNQVKVKFNSGGLENDLKNRESEEIEIDRISTIDGFPMDALQTEMLQLDGRRIFLKTRWEAKPENMNTIEMSVFSNDGNVRDTSVGYPLENLASKSHEEAQAVIYNAPGSEGVGSNGIMIFANFDRNRKIRIYGNNLKFKTKITRSDFSWAFFKVSLVVFKNGTAYDLKQRIPIFHSGYQSTSQPNVLSINNVMHSINFDQTLDLLSGESVSLEILIKADLTDALSGGSRFTVLVNEFDGKVYAEENSIFPATKSKIILAHEFLDRLATICTNKKNVIKSDFFGRTDINYANNGVGAFTGINHGFWIRQFDKLPISEDNRFKPLTTSFKDAIGSLEPVWNIALGIESSGSREWIRIEDKRYFYQPVVTIKLPNQVNNVKRSVATEYYFSSVEAGFESGGNYEEAQGLDEPNGTSKFTTIINKVKETFSLLSKYRADSYGMEFARRKPFVEYGTTDTSYDSDIFLNDMKPLQNGIYGQRKYQDDFDVIPTGIFSPETATNLRFSPVNIILRNSWWIANCLRKFSTDYVRYASSSANSKLKTKLKVLSGGNGNEYSEDGNILNSELHKSRFVPEYIEFEHELDFYINEKLETFTDFQGKKIPNLYGLIEFINERNEIERGYFINLKPNDKGIWKLLKAN